MKKKSEPTGPPQPVSGILELLQNQEQGGYLRSPERNLSPRGDDPFVPGGLIRRMNLRPGCMIEAQAGPPRSAKRRNPVVVSIETIDGEEAHRALRRPRFEEFISIDPEERFRLEEADRDLSLRVVDLIAPVGKGQRGLFVAPPRSGKTVLLQKIAASISQTHPDTHLMVLLIDERPEEVTEWRRTIDGEVFWSSSDEDAANHVRVAELVLHRARRLVEAGQDVLILLDSLTRLGRAYNLETRASGRTLSGGVDAKSLARPKSLFGTARNVEGGGSLSILATVLIETGSRMDQVIFEEFKGTGNMEIVLSRQLADRRVYPAIDLNLSGTRKEEKLLGPDAIRQVTAIRRVLNRIDPVRGMEMLLDKMGATEDNREFLDTFDPKSA
ncbi:MAG: transcription termination factor Rho [Planctomycetota bacterium]